MARKSTPKTIAAEPEADATTPQAAAVSAFEAMEAQAPYPSQSQNDRAALGLSTIERSQRTRGA